MQALKSRASARGENLAFNINQVRTKFKKCVSICKQAALTIKTSTGIKRFQEERELGEWFNQLFPVVRTRDSCQPEHAVEPSSSEGVDRGKMMMQVHPQRMKKIQIRAQVQKCLFLKGLGRRKSAKKRMLLVLLKKCLTL